MANVDRLKSKNVPLDKRITNIGEYFHFQNSKEAAKVRIIKLEGKVSGMEGKLDKMMGLLQQAITK